MPEAGRRPLGGCGAVLVLPNEASDFDGLGRESWGSVGLGNWRGSRLQTVYRRIGIGAYVGKYRVSFAGLDPPGLVR